MLVRSEFQHNLEFPRLYDVPESNNSVGSGHVSHRRTYALCDHFDHSFIVFINLHALCDHFDHSFIVFINLPLSFELKKGLAPVTT